MTVAVKFAGSSKPSRLNVLKPVSVNVNCYDTERVDPEQITACVQELFPTTPRGLIQHLNLLRPIYRQTAAYGHFGRSGDDFTWERTDMAEKVRSYLGP